MTKKEWIKEKFESRKSDRIYPPGRIDPIKKYWYPSEKERCKCCEKIDVSKNPFALLYHCKSIEHIGNLYDKFFGSK